MLGAVLGKSDIMHFLTEKSSFVPSVWINIKTFEAFMLNVSSLI